MIALVALVTAYAIGDGYTPGTITASGHPVTPGVTLACPKHIDLGAKVWIHGVGVRTCQDRGGAIVGHRFDLAMGTPAEARAWGVQRLRYSVLPSAQPDPNLTLRVFRGKAPAWNCSFAPFGGGSYSAAHCLRSVQGPGWTIYAGRARVRHFTIDPSRDIAHFLEGASSGGMRTPLEGELGTLRGQAVAAHELRLTPFEGGSVWVMRRWCVANGDGFGKGVSGSGIYGSDGALLGVVSGGSFTYDAGPMPGWGCSGFQSIYATDVP